MDIADKGAKAQPGESGKLLHQFGKELSYQPILQQKENSRQSPLSGIYS